MPRLDRTGPEGRGPQTGRGLGRCANPENTQQFEGLGRGRGFRNHRGGAGPGRGRRKRYHQDRAW